MQQKAAELRVAIVLPTGFALGGVTMWGVRTASALAARGARVAIVMHDDAGAPAFRPAPPDPVRIIRTGEPGPTDAMTHDHHAVARFYADAAADGWWGDGPIVFCPQLSGACYGACAEAARLSARPIRIAAWAHSDNDYDYAMLGRFEPSVSRFAAVSEAIAARLRERLPGRLADVVMAPHGVEAAAGGPSARATLDGRPLRLLYAGRLDLGDKRVGALIEMSRILGVRGVHHELRLVGDGPGAEAVRARARGAWSVRVEPPTPDPRPAMRGADLFLLGSRWEGSPLAMLEAMAEGCGVVAASCAGEAPVMIDASGGGVVCPAAARDDEVSVGTSLADGVERAMAMGPAILGRRAWAWVLDHRSPHAAADAAAAVLAAASQDDRSPTPPIGWRADRPWTVPHDAGPRLGAAIDAAIGPVALWGGGMHTRWALGELAPAARARVACIIDDDPGKRGGAVEGVPVVDLAGASRAGVREVVLSSWLHEGALWSRRGEAEAERLTVRRIYSEETGTGGAAPGDAMFAGTNSRGP